MKCVVFAFEPFAYRLVPDSDSGFVLLFGQAQGEAYHWLRVFAGTATFAIEFDFVCHAKKSPKILVSTTSTRQNQGCKDYLRLFFRRGRRPFLAKMLLATSIFAGNYSSLQFLRKFLYCSPRRD